MKNLKLLKALPLIGFMTGCLQADCAPMPLASAGGSLDTGYMRGVNISHYLSQLGSSFSYGDISYVGESDFEWLSKEGYDHIRLPVDGPYLVDGNGTILAGKFEQIDRTINWANAHGLNVLLDMHKLPGSNFSGDLDTRLFEDKDLQETAFRLWKYIAGRYKGIGRELRFEILNEPVSDHPELVTAFYARAIRIIREISPDRVIHVCSNRWGRIETIGYLEPLLPDSNLVVDIHYYDPHIFTHQKASWVQSDHPDFPELEFPGTVPDLSDVIPADHYGHHYSGRELTVADLARDFEILAAWSRKNSVRVYNGEFGAYYKAPAASRKNWYKAVLDQCRKHGIGWAVWDYQGGFAIRDHATGKPTLVHETIKPYLQK